MVLGCSRSGRDGEAGSSSGLGRAGLGAAGLGEGQKRKGVRNEAAGYGVRVTGRASGRPAHESEADEQGKGGLKVSPPRQESTGLARGVSNQSRTAAQLMPGGTTKAGQSWRAG